MYHVLCVSLIPLRLYFPYHFKFSNCGFMVQGIFQEYKPTQRVNNSDTSKTPNFSVWKHPLVSQIPDSHKVLYCCRLFAFTENPLHFLSSSIPADLRSSTTKFQKPPTFHHAQSVQCVFNACSKWHLHMQLSYFNFFKGYFTLHTK